MSFPQVWYLDTNGDGTGTKNAVGDYSSAAELFKVTANSADRTEARTDTLRIHRMMVSIEDATAPDADGYGGGSALTNGVTIGIYNNSDVLRVNLTDGITIKTNAEWGRLAGPDAVPQTYGTGINYVTVRWSFDKFGGPIELKGGESLGVSLNDSFTFLTGHYFVAQGTGERA